MCRWRLLPRRSSRLSTPDLTRPPLGRAAPAGKDSSAWPMAGRPLNGTPGSPSKFVGLRRTRIRMARPNRSVRPRARSWPPRHLRVRLASKQSPDRPAYAGLECADLALWAPEDDARTISLCRSRLRARPRRRCRRQSSCLRSRRSFAACQSRAAGDRTDRAKLADGPRAPLRNRRDLALHLLVRERWSVCREGGFVGFLTIRPRAAPVFPLRLTYTLSRHSRALGHDRGTHWDSTAWPFAGGLRPAHATGTSVPPRGRAAVMVEVLKSACRAGLNWTIGRQPVRPCGVGRSDLLGG